MAITKRTRYEVLRRDNHACRYCGATAPTVELTVDHVTPTALGGTDAPDNLVAACRDCNAGKASTSPDAALVADVRADALRHAELLRGAYAVLVERIGDRNDYIDEFEAAYEYEMPPDWRNSIGRWFEMGVPIELLVDAAERACAKPQGSFRGTGRFSYLCGIVWNQVRMVDELAEAYRAIEGSFMSDEALTNVRIEAYEFGAQNEQRLARRYDPLSIVVDRINYAEPWEVRA